MALIINTRRLFPKLLRTFEIDAVCDVGSMDGFDSLRFRRARPAAEIIALEPNPRNFVLMQADEQLRRKRIRILPVAASDRDSEAPFFVLDAEYVANRNFGRRGMSSLLRRTDGSRLAEIVQVRTTRLDSLVTAERVAGPLALWIDTEGMALETIVGARGILDHTRLVHVEVETVARINPNQRLFPEVERTLLDAGFVLFATDYPPAVPQFNALFIRAELLAAKAREIDWLVRAERLRHGIRQALHPLVPPRLRRFVAYRLSAVRRP